jgi:hypothetical protein
MTMVVLVIGIEACTPLSLILNVTYITCSILADIWFVLSITGVSEKKRLMKRPEVEYRISQVLLSQLVGTLASGGIITLDEVSNPIRPRHCGLSSILRDTDMDMPY